MLAVYGDEQLRGAAQYLQRYCLAIEPGPASAIVADDPTQLQLAIAADGLLLEQMAELPAGR